MPKAGEVALWPRPLAPSTIEVVWRALFCSRSSSSSSYPPWLQAHRSLFHQHLPAHVVGVLPQLQCTVYTSILACSRGFFVVPTTAASAPPCSPLAASVQPTDAHVLVVPRLVVAITWTQTSANGTRTTSRTHPVEPWTPQSLRLPQRSVPLQTTLWPHLRGHLIPYYCVCYPLLLFVTSNGTPITTNQDACYYWWSDLNHQQPTTRTSPKLAEADLCGLSRWRRST